MLRGGTDRSELPRRRSDKVNLGSAGFSYGWIVVAGLFAMAVLVQGIALGAMTLFDEKLLAALKVPRGAFKLRDSIFLLSTALSCLALGRITELIGVRRTMILGLFLLSLVMLGYSYVPPLPVVYLLHLVLGFSLSTAHVVMIMIVLSRWFEPDDPRRGIALGFAVAGASCGAVLMSHLVARWLAHMVWTDVFRLLALLPLLMMPIVLALVRPPREGGRDGWRLDGPSGSANLREALAVVIRSRSAVLLLLGIVPIFYVSAAIAVHTVLLLRDLGLSLQVAAGGVGTMFLFGLVGKLSSGFLLIRLSLRTCWLAFVSMMLAGSILLWFAALPAHSLAIAMIGLGWGGCFPLAQLRIASVFDGPNLPRILGIFVVLESIGSAVGAWLTGALFDFSGSYVLPLALNAGLLAFAWLVALGRVEQKVYSTER
jgi:MFS family permease